MKILRSVLAVSCGLCLLFSFSIAQTHNYNIDAQSDCTEVTRSAASSECGWKSGLSSNVDSYYLDGKIVAYRIQWFSGSWSGWYVPGVNDLDTKYNTGASSCTGFPMAANSLRRMWSYFFDHNHKYIVCKN